MPECIPEDALPANHRVHRHGPAAAAEWLSWRCWGRGRVPEDDPPSGSATADTGSHPSRAQGEGSHVLICSACALVLVPVLAFVLVLVRHTSCSSTASAGMQCPQHNSRLKLGCPGGGVAQPPVCGALDEPCERPGWLEPPLGRCISGQPGRLLLQAHCGLSAAGEAQLRRVQLSCRLTS